MQEEINKIITELDNIEERVAALGNLTEYKGPLIDTVAHIINAKAHLRTYIAAETRRQKKVNS